MKPATRAAAIYSRKSTEQDTHEDAKSVTRQIDRGRAFIAQQGWALALERIFVDDGVSGAYDETRRPGLKALLDASDAQQITAVVMADPSRLARDLPLQMRLLDRITRAGVTVAYYRDGRMVDFNTPIGQVTEAFHGFAAADYRKKVTEAATEALKQRAGVGAVVGGTIPGYRNVRRNGFVYRAIDPATAPLIKRIFALYTEDLLPQRTIAKLVGWSKPEVKHALTRSIYTGRIVSRWRDGSVFAVTDETLRIIDDRTWQAAQRRRAADRRLYLREPETGRLWSKPARTVESRWLLAGFLRCGACGGGMVAITRHQQKHFICLRHFQGRGAARGGWCGSKLAVPMRALDRAVLDRIVPLIDADVLKDAHAEALRIIRSRAAVTDRTRWTAALRRVDAEVARLVGYIKRGRASDAVSRALAEAEATQRDLRARLAELESYAATAQQMAATQAATLDDVLARWRAVFDAGHVPQLRQLLAKLLRGERLTVTGDLSDRKRRWATFSGAVSLAPLLGGLVVPATARAVPDHLSARTQVSLLPPPWEELTT